MERAFEGSPARLALTYMDFSVRKRFALGDLSSALKTPSSIPFGEAVKFLRDNAKLTQDEVAEKCGIQASEISRLENGKGNPTHETIHRLAKGLGAHPAWITTLEEVFASRLDG
jgi:DNA-binding XRE family transcriptional regulator